MSSISIAGLSRTIPRNERRNVPTSVKFGKGNNIPHGMKFIAKGNPSKKRSRRSSTPSDNSDPSDPSSDGNSSEVEEPVRRRGRRKSSGKSNGRDPSSSPSESSSSPSSSLRSTSPSSTSSSSSSDSSSSDSESSDRDRRRKRKAQSKQKSAKRKSKRRRRESKAERDERQALAKHRIEPPSVYDGKPDLAVFDKWTYEVNTWVRLTKYCEPTALNLLVKYTSGTAGEFFMSFIAGSEKKWN